MWLASDKNRKMEKIKGGGTNTGGVRSGREGVAHAHGTGRAWGVGVHDILCHSMTHNA